MELRKRKTLKKITSNKPTEATKEKSTGKENVANGQQKPKQTATTSNKKRPIQQNGESAQPSRPPQSSQLCALEQAKAQLHTSCVPKMLLNRDDECAEIRKFIRNAIKPSAGEASHVLYISGVPGTGKTASVLKVQRDLRAMKTVPHFHFVNINGLELSDPKLLFPIVFRKINPNYFQKRKKISPRDAQQKLNEYFTDEQPKKGHKPIVILVDEVDMLYTKREEVLYTVFNWTSLKHSRCCVIAISNTLDLAERNFSQRIVSRIGTNRMIFQPYEFTQIEAILKHRISACPAINDKAIELASKKVASISGDLRKALELMRRSIEIALEECEEQGNDPEEAKLESRHVIDAIRESRCSIRMDFIRALSQHELLLFRALVKDLYESALEDTIFSRVLHHYRQFCFGEQITPLSLDAAFFHMKEMADAHLVILAKDGGEYRRRVQLGFPVSEAQFCIRQLSLADNNRSPLSLSQSPYNPRSSRSPSCSPGKKVAMAIDATTRRISRCLNFEEETDD